MIPNKFCPFIIKLIRMPNVKSMLLKLSWELPEDNHKIVNIFSIFLNPHLGFKPKGYIYHTIISK